MWKLEKAAVSRRGPAEFSTCFGSVTAPTWILTNPLSLPSVARDEVRYLLCDDSVRGRIPMERIEAKRGRDDIIADICRIFAQSEQC